MKPSLWIRFALSSLLIFVMLQNCREKENTSAMSALQSLEVAAFEEKLNATTESILLDVRTPAEYAEGHLAQATLMNFQDPDFSEQVSKLDKSKPVFVYCAAGGRSEKAANMMKAQGFAEVIQLTGGIIEWSKANKPVVKE